MLTEINDQLSNLQLKERINQIYLYTCLRIDIAYQNSCYVAKYIITLSEKFKCYFIKKQIEK